MERLYKIRNKNAPITKTATETCEKEREEDDP